MNSPRPSKWQSAMVGRALLILLMALVPISALAHTKLARSQPKSNEVLSAPPKLIELWFTEDLEPGLTTIEVKDAAGKRVDSGSVALSDANKKASLQLNELQPGRYMVAWKTVSADQHAIKGRFAFSVAAPKASAIAGSPSAQTPEPVQVTSPPETVSEGQGEQVSFPTILVRWLSYSAMMILFGGFAFRSLVIVPLFRRSLDEIDISKAKFEVERCVFRFLSLSVIVLAITSVIALAQQASAVFDKSIAESLSPSVLIQTLRTGYGASWILQTTTLVAIVVVLFLLNNRRTSSPDKEHSILWWLGLLAGALLLLAPSWTGHAVASAKDFRLAVITDWLHLLAGGLWVGSLFLLVLTLPATLATIPKSRHVILIHRLITLFTRLAIPSVGLLALAGLYNTWTHVPTLKALWVTPYGKTLLAKLVLVVLMLGLGAVNNFHFGKRAARLSESQLTESDVSSVTRFERRFRRSVAFEAALGVTVLLVTAVLVFLTPARSHPGMSSSETKSSVVLK